MLHPKKSKKILVFLFSFWLTSLSSFAQWSESDSLSLARALSKEDTIRLNPETIEAIRMGNFLNLGNSLTAPNESMTLDMPLVKDFSEYFEAEDTLQRPFRLTDLPAHIVLRHYNPKRPAGMLDFSDEYFYFYLKNATRGLNAGQGHDFAHVLNMVMSPGYRQWVKNQKNAANLRYYNELPSAALHEKQKQFLTAHPELRKPANAAEAAKMKAELAEKEGKAAMDSLSTNQSLSAPDSVYVESPADSSAYKTQPH